MSPTFLPECSSFVVALFLRLRLPVWCVLILLMAGCAQKHPAMRIPSGTSVLLEATPFFAQEEYQCGPASLAMILKASGVEVHPDDLAPRTYLPERRGSLQLELIAASRQYQRLPFEIERNLVALIDELQQGRPVLVLQNYGLESLPAYHYAVVIGVEEDDIILRSGTTKELHINVSAFLMSWIRAGSWGLIALRPGELPVRTTPEKYLKVVNDFSLKGEPQLTEQSYLAALDRWPDHHAVRFALGNNYLQQQKTAQAASQFKAILKDDSENIAAANNLAESYLRNGCYTEAMAIINRTVERAKQIDSPLLPFVLQSQQEIENALKNNSGRQGNTANYSTYKIHEITCPKGMD